MAAHSQKDGGVGWLKEGTPEKAFIVPVSGVPPPRAKREKPTKENSDVDEINRSSSLEQLDSAFFELGMKSGVGEAQTTPQKTENPSSPGLFNRARSLLSPKTAKKSAGKNIWHTVENITGMNTTADDEDENESEEEGEEEVEVAAIQMETF
eukprot:m.63789 g.63789  ORF g.63789 m.63789 type:complete len:152 (-) comp11602_c0_seq1:27-482(-)